MSDSTSVGGLVCSSCHAVNPSPTDADFRDYFEGRSWVCGRCGKHANLWDRLLELTVQDNRLAPGIVPLGLGRYTLIGKRLVRDKRLVLDLTDYGVPDDATIIDVFMTPFGSSVLFPSVATQALNTRAIPHGLVLDPIAQPGDEVSESGLNIMVIWMPPPDEPEIEPLFSAAKAFVNEDYRESIIPAQVAVEFKLAQILTEHFSQFAGKNDVQSFLTNGATYGHQLRFLWPSLMQAGGAPNLPNQVGEGLKHLNKVRNKVGHQHELISRSEAARCLVAALFGNRYLRIFAPQVLRVLKGDSSV